MDVPLKNPSWRRDLLSSINAPARLRNHAQHRRFARVTNLVEAVDRREFPSQDLVMKQFVAKIVTNKQEPIPTESLLSRLSRSNTWLGGGVSVHHAGLIPFIPCLSAIAPIILLRLVPGFRAGLGAGEGSASQHVLRPSHQGKCTRDHGDLSNLSLVFACSSLWRATGFLPPYDHTFRMGSTGLTACRSGTFRRGIRGRTASEDKAC